MTARLLAVAVTCACLSAPARAQPPQELVICDFDDAEVDWRSKFTGHEVVSVERDGQATRALRLRFDLSQAPHYDWFRAMIPEGVDVRPFRYLSFRLHADGNGARMTPMLMQSTERSEALPHGEIVASAGRHWIALDFEGWRLLSVPLEAFGGLDGIAGRVHMVNFALQREGGAPGRPAELLMDEVMLVTQPRGEVVQEQVPFPPADIEIADEAAFLGLLDLDLPELSAVREAAQAEDWSAAKQAWARHLETRERPRWTWSRRDRDRIVAALEQRGAGLQRHVPAADRALARDFNWLGVRKQLDHEIEWLQGPVEWTHVLSRFGWWRDIAYAYWATGEDRYAEDFVFTLTHWIESNPVPRILSNARGERGTVWRTLETGIRGDLWFDIMELFMDAPQFDAEAKWLMTKSLVEHARHLHRYTVAFRHGNWQVVECTGLAAVGIMLPEFREAAGWRERAFDFLVQHMERDVYPDGAHYELTPGYHGWVMERFLKVSLLCRQNGYEVPGLLERHEKMFEFLMHISKPDRRFPAVGDAGSSSIAANMGLGALLYDRADMRYLGPRDIVPGWVWLFGPDVAERYAQIAPEPPDFTSSMLPHAQYLMMRTGWEPQDKYLLFDCAPWGGGHSHLDRLQVVVYAGRDLLIDPGIYSYDQPLSGTYFRKSEAHNVLLIDGQEQPRCDPEVLAWAVTHDTDFAAGEIEYTDRNLRHRRSVLFVRPDYWVVVDHVFGEGERELTRQFHFPRVDVATDERSARTRFEEGTNILVTVADDARVEMREGWIPTGGATAERSPMAVFMSRATLPAAVAAVLAPFEDREQLPRVTALPGEHPLVTALRVEFPDGQVDEIAIAPETMDLTLGEHTGTARALCVRTGPRSNAVSILNGSRASGR